MQEGTQDYITKPFEVDELLSRVRQIFDSLEPEDPTQPRTQPVP
jgi:DNA-binding response OmpR family regulator